MRSKNRAIVLAGLMVVWCSAPLLASVVDRVAVVVGKNVITESEVMDELRLSQFEAGQPLDLSAAKRREAAERLVDQQLLRAEMQISGMPQLTAADADKALRQFRSQRYSSLPLFRAALEKYSINEEALKQHLVWEVSVIQFTDQRFRPLTAAPVDTANRAQTASDASTPAPDSQTVDQQMDAWLKDQRTTTRIVFKNEAFQ